MSVRGFGKRSTFGVRGVRILIDGIPATMPDGQGQAATASLTSARRIELLRGPLAQLYGNAAGGVLQVFTRNQPVTPEKPEYSLSAGAGSDGQRHLAAGIAGGSDTLNARIYGGRRQVDQKLAFQTNGVVNLDHSYGGVGASWTRAMQVKQLPVRWTVGIEADQLRETRKGFDNLFGNNGALRRNEDDTAPNWQAIAGVRASRVRFSVDDRFNPAASSTSGSVAYRATLPVVGLVWHAAETLNVYANLGTGFETPTLAESAYRPGGAPGPNFALKPSKSTQGEIGVKPRSGLHSSDAAPGYAVVNARLSREFRFNGARMLLYGRIDNLLDKTYAGSLIVNDNNGRSNSISAHRQPCAISGCSTWSRARGRRHPGSRQGTAGGRFRRNARYRIIAGFAASSTDSSQD